MKIIINVHAQVSEKIAVARVLRVLDQGKISQSRNGDCFCLASTFTDCTVTADLTKSGTHVFNVLDL